MCGPPTNRHFKDEEAGAERQLHKVPRWAVGFNLVFLTPETVMFSCSLLKCQNNCHMRVSFCQSGRPKTQSETAWTSDCLLWKGTWSYRWVDSLKWDFGLTPIRKALSVLSLRNGNSRYYMVFLNEWAWRKGKTRWRREIQQSQINKYLLDSSPFLFFLLFFSSGVDAEVIFSKKATKRKVFYISVI